jgi:ATP-binding protein involved in chromosome partitioning
MSSTKHNLANVKHIVAVAAGKGGVGKSTLALNLALYFQTKGYRVGLMDADLYGPSLKKMLPEEIPPAQNLKIKDRIIPAQRRGIKLISMAYFLHAEDPTTVRAPIANGIIKQFIHLVDWEELDFLFIDFPPGTGDIQLTLIQEGLISGATLVTTPQEIALLDVVKTVAMFRQMQVPLIGVVENMSYYRIEGDQSQIFYPFGQGGGERLAYENGLFFLGKIPIEEQICRCCDQGKPLFEESANTSAATAVASVAEKVREQLEAFDKLKVDHLKNFDLQWQR